MRLEVLGPSLDGRDIDLLHIGAGTLEHEYSAMADVACMQVIPKVIQCIVVNNNKGCYATHMLACFV